MKFLQLSSPKPDRRQTEAVLQTIVDQVRLAPQQAQQLLPQVAVVLPWSIC